MCVAKPLPARANAADTVVGETNAFRESLHLAPLTVSPLLVAVAAARAVHIEETGELTHCVSMDDDVETCARSGYAALRMFRSGPWWGENIVWSRVDRPEDAITLWGRSPTHRANLANEHYLEVGVAVAWRGTSFTVVAEYD